MADKLLDLVDRLIGNVLQGNVYNNQNTYLQHIRPLQSPSPSFNTFPGEDGQPQPYPVPSPFVHGAPLTSPNPPLLPRVPGAPLSQPFPAPIGIGPHSPLTSPYPVPNTPGPHGPLDYPNPTSIPRIPGDALHAPGIVPQTNVNDKRPLNVKANEVGRVIDPTLGLDRPPFLTSAPVKGPVANQTPQSIRTAIYNRNYCSS